MGVTLSILVARALLIFFRLVLISGRMVAGGLGCVFIGF